MQTSMELGLVAALLSSVWVGSASAQTLDAGTPRLDASAPATDAARPDAGTVVGPWTSEGLPPVPPRAPFELPDDEDLRFIIEDGASGWTFFDCASEADDEPPVEDEEALPVGGGRTLACVTSASPAVSEQTLMGQDGARYCWRGAAVRYRTVSDARLSLRVTDAPPAGPWSLRATSEQPWVMKRSAFAIGVIWPLWLEVQYQTVDFAPAVDARCDGVF